MLPSSRCSHWGLSIGYFKPRIGCAVVRYSLTRSLNERQLTAAFCLHLTPVCYVSLTVSLRWCGMSFLWATDCAAAKVWNELCAIDCAAAQVWDEFASLVKDDTEFGWLHGDLEMLSAPP